jgi:hypothetical protein
VIPFGRRYFHLNLTALEGRSSYGTAPTGAGLSIFIAAMFSATSREGTFSNSHGHVTLRTTYSLAALSFTSTVFA